MIRSFKKHLKQISEREPGAFGAGLRGRTALDLEDEDVTALRHLVMTIPELMELSWSLATAPAAPSGVKTLSSFALAYLYHPRDLLPESELGLLGYLDDAYMFASAVQRAVLYVPHTAHRWGPDTDELLRKSGQWLELARKALPEVTAKLDEVLDGLEKGRTDVFEALLAST